MWFCSEHQEYMRQIHEAKDPRIREDLERELDALVLKMEAKGQQISKVRQHQQKVTTVCICMCSLSHFFSTRPVILFSNVCLFACL